VPAAEAVNVAWQDALPRVPATRLHGLVVPKLPVAVPELEKATVPVGVKAVPAVEVSVTMAVQMVEPPTAIGFGEQETVVEVVLGLTTTLAVPLDPP